MDGSIRVLIADDHAIVRKGIRALLATEPDIEVVGEAASGQEAIVETQRLRPDVVLMDLLMPELDGIDAIRRINQRQPETRILVLTSFVSNGKVFGAVEAGALGYLLKDAGPEELAKSIRQVYRWEPSFQPAVARKLLQTISGSPPSGTGSDALTGRELEVLRLVACGHSNWEIANRLSISEGTVRGHVSSILAKLRLSSRTQAALYALREGLASLNDADELLAA